MHADIHSNYINAMPFKWAFYHKFFNAIHVHVYGKNEGIT